MLLNIFLNGLLFKYKRDILLQGISTYDDALKRAVLVERLDTVHTVGEVVAGLDSYQSSALSAIKPENMKYSNRFKSMESSIDELTKSVANLSLRSTEQSAILNNSNIKPKVDTNLDQNMSQNKFSKNQNFNKKFNSNINNNNGSNQQQHQQHQQQQQQQNNNGNSQGRYFHNNKSNNFQNSQNQSQFNSPRSDFVNNSQNQFNRGRGSVRTNNNVVNGFVPTCFFCGIRGHYSNVCYRNPNNAQNNQFVNNFRQNNNNQFRPIRQNFNNQYRQQQQPFYLQMPIPQGYQQAALQNTPAAQANMPNVQYIPVVQNDQQSQNYNQRQNSEN
jgi:hypothetical protein